MWFAIIFIVLAVFYFYNPTFQTVVNNIVAAFGNWVARNLHIPTWIMNILRWVGRTFRRGLLALLALVVVMGFIWGYAYIHQDPSVLLYALAGTAVILTGLIIVAQVFTGVGKWIGLSGENGPITKFGISFFLWILIQFGLLSIPDGWYMNHLLVVGFGTFLLIAFMFKGWYNNKPSRFAAGFLVTLFIVSLGYSTYKNYGAGNIELPRWAQNTVEAYEAKMDAYSIKKKTEGQLVLASFWTSSTAYSYDGTKFVALPKNKYQAEDIVTVAKMDDDPIHSKGESMLEVVEQNEYGDMLGTNVWVPARKLEYLSPSELKKKQVKAAQARADSLEKATPVGIITQVDQLWKPPKRHGAEYIVVLPPGCYLKFESYQNKGVYHEFDNTKNNNEKRELWRPSQYAYGVEKIKFKKGGIKKIVILKK